MPVFNGERFLEAALESILRQSFEDFELVIADNASADRTQDICRAYAARDDRVQYVRNRSNYGYVHNFNNVFRLTTGEYFKWAAYDDICEPDFLLRCVEVLDGDLSVVLACSRVGGLDEDGHRTEHVTKPGPRQGVVTGKHLDMDAPVSAAAPDPTKRWRYMMENLWWTPHLYGLIRAEVLARTNLHPAHYMGDHILLAEIALHGKFYEVPEELLLLRVHASKTSRVGGARSRFKIVNPDKAERGWLLPLRLAMVYPKRLAAHVTSVRCAPLTLRQRLVCYYEIARAVLRWATAKGRGFVGRRLGSS